jgi:hypothetical protein
MISPENNDWDSKINSLLGSLKRSKVLDQLHIEKTNSDLSKQLQERIFLSLNKTKTPKVAKKNLEKILFAKNPNTKAWEKRKPSVF